MGSNRHETGRLRQDSEPGPRDASFDVSCRLCRPLPFGVSFPERGDSLFAWCRRAAWSPCLLGPGTGVKSTTATNPWPQCKTTTSSKSRRSPPPSASSTTTQTPIPSHTQAKEGGSSCNPADPRFAFPKPKPNCHQCFKTNRPSPTLSLAVPCSWPVSILSQPRSPRPRVGPPVKKRPKLNGSTIVLPPPPGPASMAAELLCSRRHRRRCRQLDPRQGSGGQGTGVQNGWRGTGEGVRLVSLLDDMVGGNRAP